MWFVRSPNEVAQSPREQKDVDDDNEANGRTLSEILNLPLHIVHPVLIINEARFQFRNRGGRVLYILGSFLGYLPQTSLLAYFVCTAHSPVRRNRLGSVKRRPVALWKRARTNWPGLAQQFHKRTCNRIHGIVADSAYLQYIFRSQINGVADILPPDVPFSERLELLRRHETSWSNLQLRVSHEFSSPIPDRHVLQDGYLIYNKLAGILQYGYVDLLSAAPHEELCWVHVLREDIRLPLTRYVKPGSLVNLTFLDFTTGVSHPLSSKHTVRLPSNTVLDVSYAAAEILGDYVLTTVMSGRDVCCIYLVSWKSGAVTLLREIELSNRWTPLWVPRLVDVDCDLIMLMNCTANSLEICKLELSPREPRLHTMCYLEFPSLEPYAFAVVSTVDKEWVSTAEHNSRSQIARKRVVPFRSSRVGTIGLFVEYEMRTASVRELPSCWMTVSVGALSSVIYSESKHHVPTIPWTEWGPAATRVLLHSYRGGLPKPAGPFWITGSSPLVIRDYEPLRTRCTSFTMEDDGSSSLFGPPVCKSTEVIGEHWVAGKVETHLPYRDLVAKDLDYVGVVADREWIIGISIKGAEGLYYTIYHVG
ncbi:hypothetical protein F5148DRAFT_1151249 [Russula earlei]|uniref:Uncharacterized protein n=1 Tax=Russula earlei TaxID=71964 RepID=A0ACC0U116_9AGAM|nr:hypothetical protein F5148DRAFT_1151249 [Russula earlei]